MSADQPQYLGLKDWGLLIAAYLQILDRPEGYDQQVFIDHAAPCGTVRCVAGWIAHKAGWEPESLEYLVGRQVRITDGKVEYSPSITQAVYTSLGVDEPTGWVAHNLYGLLFHGDHSWPQIAYSVGVLAGHQGTELPERIRRDIRDNVPLMAPGTRANANIRLYELFTGEMPDYAFGKPVVDIPDYGKEYGL